MSMTYEPREGNRVRMKKRRRRMRGSGGIWVLLLGLTLLFVAGYFIFSFPKQVPKINYPMKMEAQIRERAAEFELDPARVAAVIYCESSFDPEAVSNVGARGLMQIMPTTGEWLATKFPDIDYQSADQLFDPTINMRFGCWYLSWLIDRYDGDIIKSTAAYHTGQGNVDEWLKDVANSQDGVSLDAIPSSATGTYVTRVVAAYDAYKELYADDQAQR